MSAVVHGTLAEDHFYEMSEAVYMSLTVVKWSRGHVHIWGNMRSMVNVVLDRLNSYWVHIEVAYYDTKCSTWHIIIELSRYFGSRPLVAIVELQTGRILSCTLNSHTGIALQILFGSEIEVRNRRILLTGSKTNIRHSKCTASCVAWFDNV
jgi:hypothetical protein